MKRRPARLRRTDTLLPGTAPFRLAGADGDLDEAAPAEASQPVALRHVLAGALGALREHEGELLLLAEEAVGVVGVGEHPAHARPHRADHGHALEIGRAHV